MDFILGPKCQEWYPEWPQHKINEKNPQYSIFGTNVGPKSQFANSLLFCFNINGEKNPISMNNLWITH